MGPEPHLGSIVQFTLEAEDETAGPEGLSKEELPLYLVCHWVAWVKERCFSLLIPSYLWEREELTLRS